MESSRSNVETPGPAAARAALDSVAEMRAHTAERITSPWWYHAGLGVAMAGACISISMRWASYGVPLFLILVPFALTAALKRSTGLSIDRYTSTPGARSAYGLYMLPVLVVVGFAMYLEWGAGVYGAVAVAGVLIGVFTVVMGYRMDEALRADVRAGRDRPGL
ncbi:hypothetical protein [Streptosporangium sp. NPDC023615]|uniref:hypothetical protein n=1 Tax=Streptosporangium sp. NPDC023615 TaxID=3154794 RepID=UPI003421BAFF